MIIDTHSHLQFAAFDEDRDAMIQRTLGQNIRAINVGTNYETSQAAVALAESYPEGMYAAIGLHPMHASAAFLKPRTDPDEGNLAQEHQFDGEKYRQLAQSKKVIAIGEIGLDYYYRPKTAAKLEQFKRKQKEVFVQQLDLAKELNLPLILHCRMAHDDVLAVLKSRGENQGVVHCFTGTLVQAQQYAALGLYIGINGIIFKLNLDQIIREVPIERMVVETDCPYLTPPQAATRRNEPAFITHTINRIAELKQVNPETVVEVTTRNAKALFTLTAR